MKKFVTSLLLTAVLATPAMAAPMTITVNDGPGSPGGLFNVVTSNHGSFGTFCLEVNEILSPYGVTYFYQVSTAARYQNVSIGTSDELSKATAWLFTFYATVTGYANNSVQNNLVQDSIWYLEGEYGKNASLDGRIAAAATNSYTLAAINGAGSSWASDANGLYGVYAMNLNDANPATFEGRKQDLLVRVPDGGFTLGLLGVGLLGLVAYSRRLL